MREERGISGKENLQGQRVLGSYSSSSKKGERSRSKEDLTKEKKKRILPAGEH